MKLHKHTHTRVQCARLLLECKADPNAQRKNKKKFRAWSVLELALDSNNLCLVRLLFDHGACVDTVGLLLYFIVCVVVCSAVYSCEYVCIHH
jgi:hypothetical protein